MKKIEKEILEILENNPQEIYYYIKRKTKGLLKKNNMKEIIKLIPFLLKKTNNDNCDWLEVDALILNINAVRMVIKNLQEIPKENSDYALTKIITLIQMNLDKLTEEDIKTFALNISSSNLAVNDFFDALANILNMKGLSFEQNVMNNFLSSDNNCITAIRYILYSGKNDEYKSLIKDNMDFIINRDNINLYELKRIINISEKIPEEDKKEINEKIDNQIQTNPEVYLDKMIKELYKRFISSDQTEKFKKDFADTSELIYMLIKEIAEYENIPLSLVKKLGSGTFSTVLEINNKVLKIGKERRTNRFPNNPFINAMAIRRAFEVNEELTIFIEVGDKLDTTKQATEEELYDLYKNLRDIGIIWSDISPLNVGRLTKENKFDWKEEINPTDSALGLEEYRNSKNAPSVGDIVILDSDFLFKEGEEIIVGRHGYYEKFKEKYENEQKQFHEVATSTEEYTEKKGRAR